jgi:O-antigen ligase
VIDALAVAFRIVLTLSIIVALLWPSVGVTQVVYEGGSLEGIFSHRNALGTAAVLALLTALARRRHGGSIALLDAILAAGCLFASNSRTSLIVLVLSFLTYQGAVAIHRFGRSLRPILGIAMVMLVAAGAWFAIRNLSTITGSFGRDSTLTGRTVIWEAVEQRIAAEPWFGIGWNAVWHPASLETRALWEDIGFRAFHSHNGYLDIAMQLGLVGLCLLLMGLVLALSRALAAVFREPSVAADWALLCTTALLLTNITETRFGGPLGWVLVWLVCFCATTGNESSRSASRLSQASLWRRWQAGQRHQRLRPSGGEERDSLFPRLRAEWKR